MPEFTAEDRWMWHSYIDALLGDFSRDEADYQRLDEQSALMRERRYSSSGSPQSPERTPPKGESR